MSIHQKQDAIISKIQKYGLTVFASGVILLSLWAYTAPMAGAVISSGIVVVDGQKKTVQHLEGG